MRIQQDMTLSMNLQVEVELPLDARDDAVDTQAQVVVLPIGGDGGPAAGAAHRWSFSPDEAESLGRTLVEAAERARAMV